MECNPCPHGKRKDSCAECIPCPHGMVKGYCVECNGCSRQAEKQVRGVQEGLRRDSSRLFFETLLRDGTRIDAQN